MKVYMCKVWDGTLDDWVDRGVFSTCAKAMGSGTQYMVEVCGDVTLLDWEHDANVYTDWFQGVKECVFFTRVVTETEIDRSL